MLIRISWAVTLAGVTAGGFNSHVVNIATKQDPARSIMDDRVSDVQDALGSLARSKFPSGLTVDPYRDLLPRSSVEIGISLSFSSPPVQE